MEHIDDAQARRVWQRVHGEEHKTEETVLEQMLEQLAQDAAVWRYLARHQTGPFPAMAQQRQTQLDCLRGIWRIRTGKPYPPRNVPPPTGTREELLRQSYARQLSLWQTFDAKARDPEFGPVFLSLREQQRNHCRMTLELIGRSG